MGEVGQQPQAPGKPRGSADPELLSDWFPRPSHQAGKGVSLDGLGLEARAHRLAPGPDRQALPPRPQASAGPGSQKAKQPLPVVLRQPPAEGSNKHRKYEYLHSSSHINESATNYRFNLLRTAQATPKARSQAPGTAFAADPDWPRSRFDLRLAFEQAVSFHRRADGFLPTGVPLTSWLASEEARHPENV